MTDLRVIPAIEQLRQREAMRALETRYGRAALLEALRAETAALRDRLASGRIAAVTGSRHQRHGGHPPYQPRARAAVGGGARAGQRRGGRIYQPRIRRGGRGARTPGRARGRARRAADGGRGGGRREQPVSYTHLTMPTK